MQAANPRIFLLHLYVYLFCGAALQYLREFSPLDFLFKHLQMEVFGLFWQPLLRTATKVNVTLGKELIGICLHKKQYTTVLYALEMVAKLISIKMVKKAKNMG